MAPVLNPPEKPIAPEPDPRERELLRDRLERMAAEKKAAIETPGPTWREWAYYEAFKWWLALVLLIVDSWIIVQWFAWGSALGLVLSLALALYAEFLLYRFLWARPEPTSTRRREPFHRTWYRPVEVGRWTPEAAFARAHGGQLAVSDEGPSADEFL